jgi:hypothetical protein
MYRAFLIAVGISMCIVGSECLVVDQAVLAYPSKAKGKVTMPTNASQDPFSQQSIPASSVESGMARREFKPPEWAPWSFLSGGAVITLYALTVLRD